MNREWATASVHHCAVNPLEQRARRGFSTGWRRLWITASYLRLTDSASRAAKPGEAGLWKRRTHLLALHAWTKPSTRAPWIAGTVVSWLEFRQALLKPIPKTGPKQFKKGITVRWSQHPGSCRQTVRGGPCYGPDSSLALSVTWCVCSLVK